MNISKIAPGHHYMRAEINLEDENLSSAEIYIKYKNFFEDSSQRILLDLPHVDSDNRQNKEEIYFHRVSLYFYENMNVIIGALKTSEGEKGGIEFLSSVNVDINKKVKSLFNNELKDIKHLTKFNSIIKG